MTTCGIKKYDDLPARVGLYDVDFLRYTYKRHISSDWTCLPVIKWLYPPLNIKEKSKIKHILEFIKNECEKNVAK